MDSSLLWIIIGSSFFFVAIIMMKLWWVFNKISQSEQERDKK